MKQNLQDLVTKNKELESTQLEERRMCSQQADEFQGEKDQLTESLEQLSAQLSEQLQVSNHWQHQVTKEELATKLMQMERDEVKLHLEVSLAKSVGPAQSEMISRLLEDKWQLQSQIQDLRNRNEEQATQLTQIDSEFQTWRNEADQKVEEFIGYKQNMENRAKELKDARDFHEKNVQVLDGLLLRVHSAVEDHPETQFRNDILAMFESDS